MYNWQRPHRGINGFASVCRLEQNRHKNITSIEHVYSIDLNPISWHDTNVNFFIKNSQMTEVKERIKRDISGVQVPPSRLQRRNAQNLDESCNTKNEPHHLGLCIRESTQLFHDRHVQRHKIDQIVKFLVQEPIMSEVETDYIFSNVTSRLTYLKTTEFVSIDGSLNGATKRKGYPKERLSDWEKNKKIFSVCVEKDKFYPAFQFAKAKPKLIIEKVIQLLPDYMHGWLIAYWFSDGNGWLSGEAPKDLLDRGDKVLHAARQVSLDEYRF